MEDNKKLFPPLPSNYVTIVDLQNRWLQQKQQQQQQQQQQTGEEHIKEEKFEHNHNLSNKIIDKEVVKSNTQFQKFNQPKPHLNPNFKPRNSNHGKIYQKKQAEELKKVSNSSEINGDTANRIIDGDCEEKSSRFRKPNCYGNPKFGNLKLIYRNFGGEKRLKKVSNAVSEESSVAINSIEIDDRKVEDEKKVMKKKKKKRLKKVSNAASEESNVAVNSIEIDDRKIEDEKKMIMKKKRRNRNYKRRMKDRKNEEREKEVENLVDDRRVEEKDDQVAAVGRTVEAKDDQTVEKKVDLVFVEDRTVEVEDDRRVEKKEVEVIVEERTVEVKENVKDRTVEERGNEVDMKDRTVEIEEKLKELLLMNGRSTAEIDGGRRREYWSYGRGYRRGYHYGRRSWGVGRGGNVTVDGFYWRGRSTFDDGGWREVYRGYGGGENRGRGFGRRNDLVWVKKNGDCV